MRAFREAMSCLHMCGFLLFCCYTNIKLEQQQQQQKTTTYNLKFLGDKAGTSYSC